MILERYIKCFQAQQLQSKANVGTHVKISTTRIILSSLKNKFNYRNVRQSSIGFSNEHMSRSFILFVTARDMHLGSTSIDDLDLFAYTTSLSSSSQWDYKCIYYAMQFCKNVWHKTSHITHFLDHHGHSDGVLKFVQEDR